MKQNLVGRCALAVSVSLHVWAFSRSGEARPIAQPSQLPSVVELSVPLAAPPPPPQEPVVPPPEPPVVAQPLRQEQVLEEPELAAPVDEAQVAEPTDPIQELTGTTLLAEGSEGWTALGGSGDPRRGAIRAGLSLSRGRTLPRPRPATPSKPRKSEPATIPLGELSRKPIPPSLGGALKRHYPAEARRLGKSGEAKVRARVESSGRITLAKTAFETESGFGQACRQTLLESRWSAPLNKRGKPVATWVSYRCKFRIED